MNSKIILNLIGTFIVDKTQLDENLKITSVESNLQNAKKSDLVFYNVRQDERNMEILSKRFHESSYGLLIVNELPINLKNYKNIVVVNENDFLKLQKILLDQLYPNKNKLKLAGVTGTNGKTSIVNLCSQISQLDGVRAASLGTLGLNDAQGALKDVGGITTPSYIDLRKIIYWLQDKYEILFLEVSSHALKQDRLYDLRLDVAAWTNFTQDHLDYHKSMDDYFNSKCLIFKKYLKNINNCYFLSSEAELRNRAGYGILATDIHTLIDGDVPDCFKFSFNKKNLELALNLCKHLGIDTKKIDPGRLVLPKGRFSQIRHKDNLIIIDYAHTPDALVNICKAVREEIKDKKLIVLFGCGGDRDRIKRPLMAKVAYQYADQLILTNDNPRYEDEKVIMDDMLQGLVGCDLKKVEVLHDRKVAIKKGIEFLTSQAVLIIAGKGHEDYQDIKGVKYPFSDFLVVNEIIGLL
ncbi:MAG: hypothetical protein A2381_15130 [Bdellovibrionales bacterium RIFOXYB1_FULL_37_110]|nr:MAG: hypothetical protein A2181_05795 [Bdellovibrionales bacterium RIFOXYA1_FULL_38_20]OFZ47368.1 MAG: hypothetical protein A2417_12110 [Bdellovibrionales bacterium RIFOXYC1_FULL_37_79]OFZ60547.1 MAG: hypothetical protein A2381_15130 [Bdellovibrionales bacterium RIFOXYB1_FULL_37_110]OFZ64914.1 MAG: hypothetical protein A2577_02030 [Bdellovibrionales bacterium RIFOXYD1_FULL_36_51]